MNFTAPDFLPAIGEMFTLGMICVVMLAYLFFDKQNRGITYFLTQITLLGATVIAISLYGHPTEITFDGSFILDPESLLLKIFILLSTVFVLMYSRPYIRDKAIAHGEFYLLVLFSALGMQVLVSAYSFLTLYLGLEVFSLPLYAMIALRQNRPVCQEAAMKYFIMGAIASGFLLYGMSLIYGACQSLNLQEIVSMMSLSVDSQPMMLTVGLVFIAAGALFKLGVAPFHMWVPDVYEGAPNAMALFISTAPKLAGFALLLRLLVEAMPALFPQWQYLLIAVAVLSMAVGNIIAIAQDNIKRMLAYSSIANMGYMLLGLIAGTSRGYGSALFYIIMYVVMSLGAFGVITLLSNKGFELEKIDDFKGLNTRNPWLALMMLLIMFSMAGVPPSVGFFAKVGVLESLVQAHIVWLPAVALVFAIIGAYYYLRVVKVMYFDEPIDKTPVILESFDAQLAISINGLAVFFLGLFPTTMIELCQRAFLA
ncbi:MAG: nuoN [Gammaproteobacteria bacterium]|jgi:NADH-quinone oxidoreductase subunit N|nr:nuoN [Gammaproteobacteria bacterium]